MNKKIFGIRVGTYLTVLGCLICAIFVWLFAKISSSDAIQTLMLGLH